MKYASMLIGSRLIDYHRKEQRHRKAISLETPLGEEEDKSLGETLSDGKDHSEEMTVREATRKEIEELTAQMKDLAFPLRMWQKIVLSRSGLLGPAERLSIRKGASGDSGRNLLRTKRLPGTKLCKGSGVERKTMERHRKYMVALLLIPYKRI